MFLCAPTGKIGAQTSASTHFLARKVSALGSSLPIGDMKGILHVSASAVVCSERFLPTDYPPWTRFGEGEAGFQGSSPEAEVEIRGSTSESWSCERRLTNVDKKLMSDSVVCLWLLKSSKAWTAATGGYSPEGKFS